MSKFYKFALSALLLGASALTSVAQTMTFTTAAPVGTEVKFLPLTTSATLSFSVDWGNGVEVKYTSDPKQAAYTRWVTGAVEGETIVVKGACVKEFTFTEAQLTSAEITGMANLTKLDLGENELTSFMLLDFSPLESLDVAHNKLQNSPTDNPTLSLENCASALTDLNVSYNTDLQCMDIRDLTNLVYFTANDCPMMASVFICMPEDSREALRSINLDNCNLSNFYPVTLPNLRTLSLRHNNLMTSGTDLPFVMGTYPELTRLDVAENPHVGALDVTKFPKLEQLYISDCSFERIDVSQCPELLNLSASNNNLRSIDIGNNKKLTSIYVAGNPITELDIKDHTVLKSINISDTEISRLELHKLFYLNTLEAANTKLEFLDFNGVNINIMRKVDLRNNKCFTPQSMAYTLQTLPACKKTYSTNLFLEGSNAEHCDIEYLTGADMQWMCDITGDGTITADNLPKLDVTLQDATDTGENRTGHLDRLYPNFGMGMDYDLDVMETTGGKFILCQWQPQYFQTVQSVSDKAYQGVPMYVYAYPEEGLSFKSVTVNGKEIYSPWFMVTEPNSTIKVNFSTGEESVSFDVTPGQELSFLVNVSNAKNKSVWIDWGTGSRTEYPDQYIYERGTIRIGGVRIDGTAAGNRVTVYGDIAAIDLSGFGDVAADFGLWDNHITGFDGSNAPGLKLLNLYWNPITSIDLSKMQGLELLDVSFTNLEILDLSPVNLYYLRAYSDGFDDPESGIRSLASIDLSKQTNLQYLDMHNNKLTTLDVSNSPNLYYLDANGNLLSSINTGNNLLLESLNLSRNELTAVDLSNNTELLDLNVGANKLTGLDLSNNTKLTSVMFDNNAIHSIDMSMLPELQTIYLNGNGMTAADLNEVYYNLPRRKDIEQEEGGPSLSWNICVLQGEEATPNDGRRCDSSIAIDRNWTPSLQGTNGGCEWAYLDIISPVHGTIRVVDAEGNEYFHGSKVTKYLPLTIEATPEADWHYVSYSLNGEESVQSNRFEMPGIYTKLRTKFDFGQGIGYAEMAGVVIGTRPSEIAVIADDASVSIYDLNGVTRFDGAKVNGEASFPLGAGTYIVRVRTAEKSFSETVIVK
ncbi:MAG: T9SS type A sorting domain-containing protein [Muribaculaceae bacterium]|nr:T9SS type A sorting domain-containing protein [Muribaculaceae bacterium]